MRCLVCNNRNLTYLVRLYKGGTIFRCQVCDNAITYPIPHVSYSHHHFFEGGKEEEKLYQSYAKPIIRLIKKYEKGGRLLDVGAGSGSLIGEGINAGFKAEGIEASIPAVEFCTKRGLKVKNGHFNYQSYKSRTFDIIVISHVLEHVINPIKFLKAAHKILKKKGLLVLSQTNYQGSLPQLLGGFWAAWVPSEHVTHFSPMGISYILEKSGFDILEIEVIPLGYLPTFKWGNLSTIANCIYNTGNYLISRFKLLPNFSGDQMYIAARKLE